MRCPKCQFENREDVKFCEECGAKFEIVCPACKAKIPPSRKFCGECGHKLDVPAETSHKELSFDEKLAKIQKYLPKGLTEKILSQRNKIEGERKHVTVMFCDLVGFTQLSQTIGPEEAYSIMDQVYEILIHKVHDYEGTVNEFTGDGIMALFGAPIALEDAPQRAIRSAHGIHKALSRFSDRIMQEKKKIPPLKMRIGIHTGLVVVGTLGNDLRVEFKAVGDTVNLASRMEGLAEPGSTYVTEDTFRITEGLFRFEALGEYAVKGKTDAVKAYRVIAPSSHRTRFDVSAECGLTSFVGKERELDLLLDGFERSKAGRGQAFSIISEAGVGKSRLLYEFRKVVANEDVTFMEGKCLSYSRGVAYHPVIDIVKSSFYIAEDDGNFEIREKLKKGLKILDTDVSSTLPYLLELLSVKDSGVDPISMSPEAMKDRIIKALNRIILKASQIRPVIMAIEDLHWIDRSSEDALNSLLNSISGEKIFLIFTYRPEYVHRWGTKSYHSQVNLNRLSNQESLEMVTNLLGTKDSDKELEALILEKTEGVPFFIEEFIKSLRDLKIIERKKAAYHLVKHLKEVSIPSSIQDVIMARVDSLPDSAKEVLQLGSVIEREFSYELIKQVSELLEKELLSRLSMLKDAEVIFERGIYPESTYIFKHALTQEIVYNSILTDKKRLLHEKIGNAIEELYRDKIDEFWEILVEHFIKSMNYEKAAAYSKLAGNKAKNAASLIVAIDFAKKRIECLENLPQTAEIQKNIIDTRTILGLYYTQMNYHVDANEVVEPILKLAIDSGYKRKLSQIYINKGAYEYLIKEDFNSAYSYLKQALNISEELGDFISMHMAAYWLGCVLAFNCEFDSAFNHLELALKIGQAGNVSWSTAVVQSAIGAYVYGFRGKIDLSYRTGNEALKLALESDDIYAKTYVYTHYGISSYYKGFFQEAEDCLLKAINYSEKANLFALGSEAYAYLGDTYFSKGEFNKSEKCYEKAISLIEHTNISLSFLNVNKTNIIRSRIETKKIKIDLRSLIFYKETTKLKPLEGWIQKNIGEILLYFDYEDRNAIEDFFIKAIETDNRNDMKWFLGRDFAIYAEFFKRRGDLPKAKENLEKAIAILKECGAEGWVDKYKKDLAALL